jgi:glycosyltransferase involved in cell wall biosynthesis
VQGNAFIKPEISVVVPVFNGGKSIAATLESLLRQTLPALEIIVVDDGSTDNTKDTVAKFGSAIKYVYQANCGPAVARNCGIRLAKGEYVAFTDSDCLPMEDWLRSLSLGFESTTIAGVGGRVLSADASAGLISEYVDTFQLLDPLEDETGQIPYLITANACFQRIVLHQAGLFSGSFIKPGGEEPELCLRIRELGYTFRRIEGAVVLHHHRQTISAFLRTFANYGEGRYLFDQIRRDLLPPRGRLSWVREAVALRSYFTRLWDYRSRFSPSKAAFFSLMDYARRVAYAYGYWRGRRNAA